MADASSIIQTVAIRVLERFTELPAPVARILTPAVLPEVLEPLILYVGDKNLTLEQSEVFIRKVVIVIAETIREFDDEDLDFNSFASILRKQVAIFLSQATQEMNHKLVTKFNKYVPVTWERANKPLFTKSQDVMLTQRGVSLHNRDKDVFSQQAERPVLDTVDANENTNYDYSRDVWERLNIHKKEKELENITNYTFVKTQTGSMI